jgi:hypothetical protein
MQGEWCSPDGALQIRPFHIPWGKSYFRSLGKASYKISCIASCESFLLHLLVLEMEGRLSSFRVLASLSPGRYVRPNSLFVGCSLVDWVL